MHQNYSLILRKDFSLSRHASNQGVLNKSSWVATILFQCIVDDKVTLNKKTKKMFIYLNNSS